MGGTPGSEARRLFKKTFFTKKDRGPFYFLMSARIKRNRTFCS